MTARKDGFCICAVEKKFKKIIAHNDKMLLSVAAFRKQKFK